MVLCPYCRKADRPTLKGLRSHISQTPACRAARRRGAEERLQAQEDAQVDPSGDTQADQIEGTDGTTIDADGDRDAMMEIAQDELPHDPAPEPTPNPRRVTVEEVEDIEPGGLPKRPWVGEFPHDAGSILRQAKTFFEEIRDRKVAASETNFAPFANREEWELASFLIRSGLSQESIEDYLTLPIVSVCPILLGWIVMGNRLLT